MVLNPDFCRDIVGCDQPRTRSSSDRFTCNLTHEPLNGMTLWDCPEVRKAMAQACKMARQEAAAELDRSAGQPPKTYIEKQSLVNLCVSEAADYEQRKRDSYLIADLKKADAMFERNSTAIEVISSLLREIVGGASVKEVEL